MNVRRLLSWFDKDFLLLKKSIGKAILYVNEILRKFYGMNDVHDGLK